MTDQQRPARPSKPGGRQSESGRSERSGGGRFGVRPEQYLIAATQPPAAMLPGAGVVPGQAQMTMGSADVGRLLDELGNDPHVRIIRGIGGVGRGSWIFPPVVVVETTPDHAALLAQSQRLYVEPDHRLGYGEAWLPIADPGIVPMTEARPVSFTITDADGDPLSDAAVYVLGESFREQGRTDTRGQVQLSIPVDEIDRVHGVFVRPAQAHWSLWLPRPALSSTAPNTIACQPVDVGVAAGWPRRVLGFDRLPPHYLGHGVRLAVIDSGVTAEVANLAERVADGLDLASRDGGRDDKGWREDVLGFGSHALGAIAAADESMRLAPLAPEAELYACKVTPGGRYSDLIDALDFCLTHDIDVVSIGVGSPYPSALLAQKLEQVRREGIVCVAAAGNTAGAALFPAVLPTVIGVGALGQIGTFPPDSYHATQVGGGPTPDGLFSARFSAGGPGVDVYAPGVAVVSLMPSGAFGAADGTSIAAAHIAALASLILAHHPDFRDGYRVRGTARVDRLHHVIRTACRPVMFGEPGRTVVGLPDAATAVGLAATAGIGATAGFGAPMGYPIGRPAGVPTASPYAGATLAPMPPVMLGAGFPLPPQG